nr:MAG TPA: hypothetical protein [Bacteriophage sp.]
MIYYDIFNDTNYNVSLFIFHNICIVAYAHTCAF